MNTQQREALSLVISKYGQNITNECTEAEIEKALGCPGLLKGIDDVCNPELQSHDLDDEFYGRKEFEGVLSNALWCFTENFDYDLTEIPNDPIHYIGKNFVNHFDYMSYIVDGTKTFYTGKITLEQATMVCDMLVHLNLTLWSTLR
jgi:hypothetical protein